MAFGSLSDSEAGGDLAEINMIPLIDVMLVLLVIFIVTAPLLTHAVRVDLPKASSAPNPAEPHRVELAIDAAGQLHWNGQPVGDAEFDRLLAAAAAEPVQPELQLRAERSTPYERVAGVMSATVRAGLSRLGFVTEPR